MLPKTRFVGITGEAGATTDTRLAAALYALDVPLDTHRTLTTMAGDGIRGVRVTWHFAEASPSGDSSAKMIKAWDDREWAKAHPECPLVNIKQAFIGYADIARGMKEGTLECFAPPGPFIETQDARMAACMVRLGHPITGIAYADGKYRFRFPQAAATDFEIWTTINPARTKHPDTLLHVLWCAFDCHYRMVGFIKNSGPQFATVNHRGRTAMVGRDMEKSQIDQLEKLLYRR
jgi:hypothetical protein